MIYLDYAATSLKKPNSVVEAVVKAMQSMGNSARGVYDEALAASRTIFEARQAIASLFNCPRADHVAFTANATEALNLAINGCIGPGEHVISTAFEHNSVLRPLYRLERERGVKLDFVPADPEGHIDYEDFSRLLRPETTTVVSTHASNVTGNLVDISRLGAFSKAHGLTYIVDASQTAGSVAIDMEAMGIDVLCFTGHKGLMGPQGTGGLCLMPGVELRPLKVGGTGVQTYLSEQPSAYPVRLEAGTLNGHGIAGLLAGLTYIGEVAPAEIHRRETELMLGFYRAVKGIDGVKIYGDFSADRCPIVALNIWDYESTHVADELAQAYGIAVRAGAHCAPLMHRALNTELQGLVRFSFGWFTTEEEVDLAAAAVRSVASC
ncbi:MAG: aminotransferase class V-fold PLP-dependent enzyme [Clostridiaceae bacterium]